MEKDKDLFGNTVKKKTRKSAAEKELTNYDKAMFPERLKRLEFINKYGPRNYSMMGEMEFVFTFSEIQQCFVQATPSVPSQC